MILHRKTRMSGAERQRKYRASGKERRNRSNTKQRRYQIQQKGALLRSAIEALLVYQPLTREQMATVDWDYLEQWPLHRAITGSTQPNRAAA